MLSLYTAPAAEPVTLEEVRIYLRIDSTEEEALLAALIVAARNAAETITRRALITQTWDYCLDAFPIWTLAIPMAPLQSITSIKYVDDSGVEQTLAPADYRVDSVSAPARIQPAYGKEWPTPREVSNAVTVRFVAGHGTAAQVPECIKTWIKMRVASLYEQREQFVIGQPIQALPHPFLDGLLDPFRVITFE